MKKLVGDNVMSKPSSLSLSLLWRQVILGLSVGGIKFRIRLTGRETTNTASLSLKLLRQ